MKYIKFLLIFISMQACLLSCKKDIPQGGPVSAFTVVNAIAGSNTIIADFSGIKPISTYYSSTQAIGFGSFLEYSLSSGPTPVTVYQQPDTTQAAYKNSINLQPHAIYSLFLCGQAAQPDAVLVTDQVPYHNPADSTVGVRFINLSPGSSPVSVDIQGNANGSEIQSLTYKNFTSFKSYPATYTISSYVFEFRDVASGTLLANYTLSGINNGTGGDQSTNQYRFKNITVVLAGLPAAQSAFQVNNY